MEINIRNLSNLLNTTGFINVDKMESNKTSVNTEVHYPSDNQFLFSDITNKLPKLNILYKAEEEKGMKEKWVLFSDPFKENMYIIFLESDMFGVTDYITAEVYDSLEIFYTRLLKELKKEPGVMKRKEKMSIKNLISIFF